MAPPTLELSSQSNQLQPEISPHCTTGHPNPELLIITSYIHIHLGSLPLLGYLAHSEIVPPELRLNWPPFPDLPLFHEYMEKSFWTIQFKCRYKTSKAGNIYKKTCKRSIKRTPKRTFKRIPTRPHDRPPILVIENRKTSYPSTWSSGPWPTIAGRFSYLGIQV